MAKVFEICNAYESGFGHGYDNDDRYGDFYADPDLNEAYKIGYQEGMSRCVSDAEGD